MTNHTKFYIKLFAHIIMIVFSLGALYFTFSDAPIHNKISVYHVIFALFYLFFSYNIFLSIIKTFKVNNLYSKYIKKLSTISNTQELSSNIFYFMKELNKIEENLTEEFEYFLYDLVLENNNIKSSIIKVILEDINNNLPVSSYINNLYINLGLTKLIKQIIDDNKIVENFIIKELLYAIDEKIYEKKASFIMTEILQNKLNTLKLSEYDLILNYFEEQELNKRILNILNSKSVEEIHNYIDKNETCNIIFKLSYIQLLLENNKEVEEYLNDLLQENWSDYEVFNTVFLNLEVKKILNKEDYKDAIKQKSTLEIFNQQNEEQQKQRAELEKINKTQQETISNLSNLADRIEESNSMQEEQLNIQKTQRAEELSKRKYIKDIIKKEKRRKLIKKVFF